MWPYFNVPLEGHIRQVWLYVMKELYMSFENEQYEYINEGYGSVEMYAICKVLWKSEFWQFVNNLIFRNFNFLLCS